METLISVVIGIFLLMITGLAYYSIKRGDVETYKGAIITIMVALAIFCTAAVIIINS